MRIYLKVTNNIPDFYPKDIYLGSTIPLNIGSSDFEPSRPVPLVDWCIVKNGITYTVDCNPTLDIDINKIIVNVNQVKVETLTKMIYLFKQSLKIVEDKELKHELHNNINKRFSEFCKEVEPNFKLPQDWTYTLVIIGRQN